MHPFHQVILRKLVVLLFLQMSFSDVVNSIEHTHTLTLLWGVSHSKVWAVCLKIRK